MYMYFLLITFPFPYIIYFFHNFNNVFIYRQHIVIKELSPCERLSFKDMLAHCTFRQVVAKRITKQLISLPLPSFPSSSATKIGTQYCRSQ